MPPRKPTARKPAGAKPGPKPGPKPGAKPRPKPFRAAPAGKKPHGKGLRGKRGDLAAQVEALRSLRGGKASHLKALRGKPVTRTPPRLGGAPPPTASSGPDAGRLAALMAVEAGLEKKAERPALLDVRGISSYADYVVVMSADNRRQIEAVALEIEHRLRGAGIRPLGSEGNGDTGWLLLDFADVVIHLFTPEARDFYDIEGLWADAPRVKTAV
jgi:ribosome-associated protein